MDRRHLDFERLYRQREAKGESPSAKSNLRIGRSSELSENTVKTQIWITITIYLLSIVNRR
jgi:hypothetical protein